MYTRITIVILCVLLSACAGVRDKKRENSLELSLDTYRKMIRWGHYDSALQYIRFRDEPQTVAVPDYLKDIRVTSYAVIQQIHSEDQMQLHMAVMIGFYHVDYGVVRSIRDQQLWWYEPEEERWFLEGKLPDFSPEL